MRNIAENNTHRPKINWKISSEPITYLHAINTMESCVRKIRETGEGETVWLLEHPPLYTAGTSAKPQDLINDGRFPVFESGRGGQYTYHGPGQRVIYLMLDLRHYRQDVRRYISMLERWLINTLSNLDVEAKRIEDRVGIWVEIDQTSGERKFEKIGAVGVRIRRWVTSHGVSLNISPNLEHFSGIVPCGISDAGVTSLAKLKREINIEKVDKILKAEFLNVFGLQSEVTLVEEACQTLDC